MGIEESLADVNWRLANLYYIVNKKGERVRFHANDAQRRYLKACGKRDIILKARQMGFTTQACIVALDECLFHANHRAGIIAHKMDDANAIFETKVKYAYDNLPEELKAQVSAVNDRAGMLKFSNGSSIMVSTSFRSGTLQRLHVSEFGKICATYPERAREIITGAFPAAENGAITIESTAEGQEGAFFEMTQAARVSTGERDFKFHFFPWFEFAEYTLDANYPINTQQAAYFLKIETELGIRFTDGQKQWYIATEKLLGADMRREYPSTPEEAFEQALEGAYFEAQLVHARLTGAVGRWPYDPRFEVNTFWDLGRNDLNAIWLHQNVGGRNRFIGYYENSGEHISHYLMWLKEWARQYQAHWGEHYLPHDGDRKDLFLEQGRLETMAEYGFRPNIVRRVGRKIEAIEAARSVFPSCDFDEVSCAQGLKRLQHYRKEWDPVRGVWKDRPRHDDNSNGADAFQTFATGYAGHVEDYDDDAEYWDSNAGRSGTTGY